MVHQILKEEEVQKRLFRKKMILFNFGLIYVGETLNKSVDESVNQSVKLEYSSDLPTLNLDLSNRGRVDKILK